MNADKHVELLRACPLCQGRIEPFQGPHNHTIGTCEECGYSFVVPATGWKKARAKLELVIKTLGSTLQLTPANAQPQTDLIACPVCRRQMEALSRDGGYELIECALYRVSRAVPEPIWDAREKGLDDDATLV